jgi:hypothetical protein
MFRRDGEVLRLGTAIGGLFGVEMDTAAAREKESPAAGERGLMHETPRAINPPGLDFTTSINGRAVMPQELIFQPMAAMALLTFVVLGFIPARRFAAVFARQVTPDDFALGESAAVPPHVALANRNYMNLLELPILFYVVCLMYFVAGRLSEPALIVAWTYVAVRAAHSFIHIAYNKVIHRLIAFAVSNFILLALWILFFV